MLKNKTRPLSEVVDALLSLIREERLSPGDRLPSIRQLSIRLGARPHTIRDALLQAQAAGHVKVHPRSRAIVQSQSAELVRDEPSLGAGVLEQDEHHLFHMLEVRQLLELEAVRQAARRRRLEDLLPVREALNAMNAVREPQHLREYVEHDIRFHLAIARIADNPVLTGMLRTLLNGLRPFLRREPFQTACGERVQHSHGEIYRALVDGDAELASAQMHEHLQLAYDFLLGEVRTLPE